METQKTSYIPTVNGVPVKDWDATVSFITDPIEFPYSIPWSFQWLAPGGGGYSVYHSNTNDINDAIIYDSLESVTLDEVINRIKTASYFGCRYMFLQYNGAGSGTLTVKISK